MANKGGVAIDLKKDKKSLEQALRELKTLTDSDMEKLKANKYHISKSKIKREKEKVKNANIRRYNKYN